MADFDALSAYRSLSPEDQVRFLLRFGWWLTVEARSYYEAGTENLTVPEAVREVNELQHQVTQHALKVLARDDRRYPDDVLVAILTEDVLDRAGLAGRVRESFARAYEEIRSWSLARAG